jgi:putative heme-binding domain-containing protein
VFTFSDTFLALRIRIRDMRLLNRRSLLCAAGMVVIASLSSAQDHGYTPADVENGTRLYQASCAGCHGLNGDGIPGIDLARGQFQRATSDTELIGIIRAGIPGTTMPPSGFAEAQAATIVAYLRSMAPSAPRTALEGALVAAAGAARGRSLFTGKGQCAGCHRVNGVGPRVAPDLSEVGAIRAVPELRQKLLDPSALMRAGNRFVEAVARDGTRITGRLLNQDSFSIQLIDSSERLVSLPKSNLREFGFMRTSPMPSYRDKLTPDEVGDLVSYLISLKGIRP